MNDEEIKQRIRYLVEHGGVYDDPLAELRRYSRTNRALIILCIVLTMGQILQTALMV